MFQFYYSIKFLTSKLDMRYICANCGYIYDPQKGDIEQGIPPGTFFEDIQEDWKCPVCYVNKEQFDILD